MYVCVSARVYANVRWCVCCVWTRLDVEYIKISYITIVIDCIILLYIISLYIIFRSVRLQTEVRFSAVRTLRLWFITLYVLLICCTCNIVWMNPRFRDPRRGENHRHTAVLCILDYSKKVFLKSCRKSICYTGTWIIPRLDYYYYNYIIHIVFTYNI